MAGGGISFPRCKPIDSCVGLPVAVYFTIFLGKYMLSVGFGKEI